MLGRPTMKKPKSIKPKVGKCDALSAVRISGGSRRTRHDAEFAEKMDKAEEIMRRYRDAMRVLAK